MDRFNGKSQREYLQIALIGISIFADLFEDMGADVMLTAEENDGWHVYACVFRLMEVHDGINPL